MFDCPRLPRDEVATIEALTTKVVLPTSATRTSTIPSVEVPNITVTALERPELYKWMDEVIAGKQDRGDATLDLLDQTHKQALGRLTFRKVGLVRIGDATAPGAAARRTRLDLMCDSIQYELAPATARA